VAAEQGPVIVAMTAVEQPTEPEWQMVARELLREMAGERSAERSARIPVK